MSRGFIVAPLLNWARGLRFPRLFALLAATFFVDLLIPDLLPFADEILLGLTTVILGNLRTRRTPASADPGAGSDPYGHGR